MRIRPLLAAPLLIAATPALAQPMTDQGPPPRAMHADAWVGDGGRLLDEGQPEAIPAAVRPVDRDGWLGDCAQRLSAANQFREPPARFADACHDWLGFYERSGQAAQGYGFAYAIPVQLAHIALPCPPQPTYIERPAPPRRPRPVWHDKRVKITPY